MIADSFSSESMLNVPQFNALIYNPIGHSRDFFMRFPINSPQVSVTDDLGQSIMAQVIILQIVVYMLTIHAHSLQVVKVTKATTQARTGLTGSSPYELIIGVSVSDYSSCMYNGSCLKLTLG